MPQMLRDQAFRRMVPVVGLEPTRSRPRRILNVMPLAESTDSLTSFTDREPNKIYTQIDRLW